MSRSRRALLDQPSGAAGQLAVVSQRGMIGLGAKSNEALFQPPLG
jgi:hypothetical protein